MVCPSVTVGVQAGGPRPSALPCPRLPLFISRLSCLPPSASSLCVVVADHRGRVRPGRSLSRPPPSARCPDLIQIREYNLIITLFVKTNGQFPKSSARKTVLEMIFLKPVSYRSLLLACAGPGRSAAAQPVVSWANSFEQTAGNRGICQQQQMLVLT